VRVTLVAPEDAIEHAAALRAIAVAAFAGPPWREDHATAIGAAIRLLTDARCDGFVLALAHTDEQPCGFAYGLNARNLESLAHAPPGPTMPFELRELAVSPAARGIGVGAALHDTLMRAVDGRRWLATHPLAHQALTLYRTRGWHAARLVTHPDTTRTRILMHRSI
jgi:GNAT superfamily N-acetyltransferase